MNAYIVDDGASHWVFAKSKKDALAVWLEEVVDSMGLRVYDLSLSENWPSVEKLSLAQCLSYTIKDDDDKNKKNILQEFIDNPKRRYLGCSEF